ncbi:metalloprotease TldD, partial [Alphaproteobacteria bacterium]|nr:metalloprotease TldD [Alphaproteobacteria bacterium]
MDPLAQTDALFFKDSNFDRDQAQAILKDALHGADDGDLFLEIDYLEFLGFDDGRLKSASYNQSSGFGLRAILGEADAFAHSGDMSMAALERAGKTVKAVTSGYSGKLALSPANMANLPLYSDANPLDGTPFDAKVKLLQEIDAYARSKDSRVKQVS